MKNLTINIGDYVRTKYGISKIIDLKENPYGEKTIYVLDNKIISMCECEEGILYSTINPLAEDLIDEFDINFGDESQIIKSSSNIIDLIEVGDILTIKDMLGNTSKVEVDENFKLLSGKIVSIVTKEQFESMEYKI